MNLLSQKILISVTIMPRLRTELHATCGKTNKRKHLLPPSSFAYSLCPSLSNLAFWYYFHCLLNMQKLLLNLLHDSLTYFIPKLRRKMNRTVRFGHFSPSKHIYTFLFLHTCVFEKIDTSRRTLCLRVIVSRFVYHIIRLLQHCMNKILNFSSNKLYFSTSGILPFFYLLFHLIKCRTINDANIFYTVI